MQKRMSHGSSLSPQRQIDLQTMLFHLSMVKIIVNGCCDFIAQCILVRINYRTYRDYHPFYSPQSSKIYRCWIVWGKNRRVVIIPSFLAIAYIGQSIYLRLISRFQSITSSYLASDNRRTNNNTWPNLYFPLGGHIGSNSFGRVYDREYPGDGHDRVQDPQGVFGS